MSSKLGYKPTTPNKNKGLKTHGSFVSSVKGKGQKPGKKVLNKAKGDGPETIGPMAAETFMKATIARFRSQGKRRISMMPESGAFH